MFEDFEDSDPDDDDASDDAPVSEGTLAPPRAATELYAHEEVEKQLLSAYINGRLPHALVFTGPAGIGKATFAFRLARFLLSQDGGAGPATSPGLFGDLLPVQAPPGFAIPASNPVFQQVASGGHPDLLVIERLMDEKKGRLQDIVAVDEVRKITPLLRLTATGGGWRVVIVDDADTMNRASQNAILKILEEPPPRTVLILVAHNTGALLPTIRSRSRVVTFLPPDEATFARLMRIDTPSLTEAEITTLRAIAGGSVGGALSLRREGGLAVVAQLITLLSAAPRWPWTDIHQLAETLGRAGQDDAYNAFVQVMLWIVRSLLRTHAGGTGSTGTLAGRGRVAGAGPRTRHPVADTRRTDRAFCGNRPCQSRPAAGGYRRLHDTGQYR